METSEPSDPSDKAIAVAASTSLASKAVQPWGQMLVLAILAGAFIAFGSIAAMIAQANMGDGGASKLLSGAVFSVGLILVTIVGGQLFTGNTMMVLSIITRELSVRAVIGACALVWLGNAIGGRGVALLFSASGGLSDGVGEAAIALADGKLAKSPAAVFCSAILANIWSVSQYGYRWRR